MNNLLTFLFRPDIFSIVILSLYLINSGWWAYQRNAGQALYWLCAFGITYSVTFMMKGQ